MDGSMALPFEARVNYSSITPPPSSTPPSVNPVHDLPTSFPTLGPSNSENAVTNPQSADHLQTAITESGPPPAKGNSIESGCRFLLKGLKSMAKVGARVLAAPTAVLGFLAAKAVTLLVASIPAFIVGVAIGTFPVWSCMLGVDGGIGDIVEKGIEAGAFLGNKLSEASGSLMCFALNDPKLAGKLTEASKVGDQIVAVAGGAAAGIVGLGVGAIGTAIAGTGCLFLACAN